MNSIQCRICLKKQKITSDIFKETKSGVISQQIMSITKLQIHPGDGLPDVICRNCNRRLQNCIEFVKLCENSDAELKKSLRTKETEMTEISEDISSCDDEYYKKIAKYENDDEEINTENIDLNSSDNSEDTILIISGDIDLNSLDNNRETIKSEDTEYIGSNKNRKKEQEAQCPICGKFFSAGYRLNRHNMVAHSDVKRYSCKYCNKKFSLSDNLIIHLRTHTGEKPYNCAICEESFGNYSNLIVHRRKHTGHTPYKCLQCPRRFRTTSAWQYHIRVHSGERNYKCDKCKNTFITQGALKQHILTHSGARLYECTICGTRFTREFNLKRHTLGAHRGANATEPSKKEEYGVTRKKERKLRNAIIN